ncbi:hypothetical protein DYD21_19225 [Rhodohalobacter sp. SW132]|uniref:hypothetical protein n=1 Tax=Rhodohalobacter sp. SW132 TaxID=2293433 RepID=UPI000E2849B3|nr:hypothetical protein [Rhodohalobacter sp. SW132]REL24340.1 hypothetical protein DYD21_19225 [Rhodohalobacter sp. SW132]
MKTDNRYISFFLSLLISAGMFLAAVHIHDDAHSYVDGFDHHITQDINECTVCASHFKFSGTPDAVSHTILSSETVTLIIFDRHISDPLRNVHEGRAPPYKS